MATIPAIATNESISMLQAAGFELYEERRQSGLVGRYFITLGQLLGLACGGGYAYVRQKKAEGQGASLGVLLLRFGLFFTWPFLNKYIIAQPFPVQFRLRLQQLGPTYIKLGQILSLREDLLPKSITDELKNLLDRLPAVAYERLKELIADDLQRPLHEMFSWIDPVPLGSASLGQTHRARLVTKEKVVIKVLKPGVPRMVEVDTRLLRFFGWFLQKFLSRYNPARLINEFSTYTLREVDLRFEADNAETFAANFKNEPDIQFPKIFRQYSSRNVLCMEYFKGIKPDANASKILTQSQKEKVIELGIRSIIEMIFRDGFFHADLHPGNIVIFPNASVGFIDLGMVGQFDSQMRKRMFYYFFSLVMGDASSAARYLSSLAIPAKGTDIEGFRRAVADLYSRWLRNPSSSENSMAQIILQSILMAGRYRIEYPGEIILMVKSLVTVEGMGNTLEPGLNIPEASRKPVQGILRSQFSPLNILKDIILVLPEMVDIISVSPLIISEGLKSFESSLKKTPTGQINPIRNSILAGFCLLAGAILVSSGAPWPVWTGLFGLAVILALLR
jgi:ubiquinone biosynthesis protein